MLRVSLASAPLLLSRPRGENTIPGGIFPPGLKCNISPGLGKLVWLVCVETAPNRARAVAEGLVVPLSLARRRGGLLSVRGSLPGCGSVAGVGTAWLNAGEREK